MIDLLHDARTLSMMEFVPRPKPCELTEAEKWYYAGMQNAQHQCSAGARAMSAEEMAESQRRGYAGYGNSSQSILGSLLGF
jgi:hypothetical protein